MLMSLRLRHVHWTRRPSLCLARQRSRPSSSSGIGASCFHRRRVRLRLAAFSCLDFIFILSARSWLCTVRLPLSLDRLGRRDWRWVGILNCTFARLARVRLSFPFYVRRRVRRRSVVAICIRFLSARSPRKLGRIVDTRCMAGRYGGLASLRTLREIDVGV